VFTFPVLQLLQPNLADASIDYRLARLPGARVKARSSMRGNDPAPLAGAMFPWGTWPPT